MPKYIYMDSDIGKKLILGLVFRIFTLALASSEYGDSNSGSLEWLLATSANNLAVIVVVEI